MSPFRGHIVKGGSSAATSIYYGGMTLLALVVMHVLTGAFGAEMMAYVGGLRTNEMQYI